MRDPQVRASMPQAAIRDGASAANAHRSATKDAAGGKPPSEPEFDRPVVKPNNQSWGPNKIAEGYVAEANIGSRESPLHIVINVPRSRQESRRVRAWRAPGNAQRVHNRILQEGAGGQAARTVGQEYRRRTGGRCRKGERPAKEHYRHGFECGKHHCRRRLYHGTVRLVK